MVGGSLVGFGRGFVAPFGAIVGLLRTPRAWPFALVPALMFVLIDVALVLCLKDRASELILKLWGLFFDVSGVSDSALKAVNAASILVLALLGMIVASVLSPVLSAPALERIVGITERELRAPARLPLGFFAELWCGLCAMSFSMALTMPVLVALFVLGLVVPPLAIITTPLKLLIGALGIAWGLFDYPLTLRGVGALQRFAFVRRHFSAVLGFGVAFTLVFWLPCFGILMLPVGVAAATRLYWEIERAG